MSTALLTWASRCVLTLYDASGQNLTNNSVTLQITEASPDRTLSPIDMTNSESNGLAEWAPGITMTEIDLSGVLDATLGFISTAFISAMDNKFLAQVQLYFVKPILGAGANNPAVLTGKFLFTNCKLENKITANGEIWRFSGKGRVIGKLALTGADVQSVTGYIQS